MTLALPMIVPHEGEPSGLRWPLIEGLLDVQLIAPSGKPLVGRRSSAKSFDAALANLRRHSTPEMWHPVQAAGGRLRAFLTGDNFAASRMLIIRELIDPWPFGGVVAIVPEPGALLCLPLDTLEAIDSLSILATAAHVGSRCPQHGLSDQLFWHDGEEWKHLAVTHGEDNIEVHPPDGFLENMERLASLELGAAVGAEA